MKVNSRELEAFSPLSPLTSPPVSMSHPTIVSLDFALPVKTSSYKPASFAPLSGALFAFFRSTSLAIATDPDVPRPPL